MLLALGAASGCVTTPAPRPPVELKAHPEPELVGVRHTVQAGETLWRIAKAYGVTVEDLAVANHLADSTKLAVGQDLFVPGVKKRVAVPEAEAQPPAVKPTRSADAPLAWPLIGVLYARFGPRGETRHDGIDLAAPEGTPVHAADDGKVVFAAEQRGYGHVVILEHPRGLITLYAHNREILVKEGARVKVGDPIARVGETIKTSGPHLHFEVRENGMPKDPLKYLPAPR